MLRTNLATRPFYNERAVYLVLGLVAVVGLAVLAAEVFQIMELSRRSTELLGRAETAEAETARLTAQTIELQRAVDPQALDEVAAAAREANTLIDQRVFSWTDFFNRIEATLPADVMVTQVQPDISPEEVLVTMGVLGRRLDDISGFIDALEASGDFAGVLNRQSELTEEGMYRATLRGQYLQALLDRPGGQGTASAASPTEGGVLQGDEDPEAEAPDGGDGRAGDDSLDASDDRGAADDRGPLDDADADTDPADDGDPPIEEPLGAGPEPAAPAVPRERNVPADADGQIPDESPPAPSSAQATPPPGDAE